MTTPEPGSYLNDNYVFDGFRPICKEDVASALQSLMGCATFLIVALVFADSQPGVMRFALIICVPFGLWPAYLRYRDLTTRIEQTGWVRLRVNGIDVVQSFGTIFIPYRDLTDATDHIDENNRYTLSLRHGKRMLTLCSSAPYECRVRDVILERKLDYLSGEAETVIRLVRPSAGRLS